jgi:hypothetical protein
MLNLKPMKAVILYHPDSEFSRSVEEYAAYFKRFHSQELELLSLETVEGSEAAKLYDILEYPSLLVIRETGEVMKVWQGTSMPLMDEVAAYLKG